MTTTANDGRVWVRTGSVVESYRLIDPAPAVADELGHVWVFDGGATDPEDPRTCLLCCDPAWKVYAKPCAAAEQLEELNTSRGKYIAENRYDGTPPGANRCGTVVNGFTEDVGRRAVCVGPPADRGAS